MAPESLVDRVKVRFLDCEEVPGDGAITEMLRTVLDRIALRVESDGDLPDAAGSIAVDAAMKALRLRGVEGSTSESAADGGSMSNSFIDDVLSAYSEEIAALKRSMGRPGIKFLG